jgi:hypothetical protein
MPQTPAKTKIPNPAFDGLGARRPRNDQRPSLLYTCDPDAEIKIARRLGTRYAAA